MKTLQYNASIYNMYLHSFDNRRVTPRYTLAQSTRENKSAILFDLCVSSLRKGHANLLYIVPIFTDDQCLLKHYNLTVVL